MVNLVKVGNHYVNIDKIVYIQKLVQPFKVLEGYIASYQFGFEGRAYLAITEEEFNEFKTRLLKIWESNKGGICHFFD